MDTLFSASRAKLTPQVGSAARWREHLGAYLDEFVFRFNRRTSSSRGMLFYRLLQQAVVTEPVTYDNVVRPLPKPAK